MAGILTRDALKMIEINLLPTELREKKTLAVPQIFQAKLVGIVVLCILATHLLLIVVAAMSAKRLAHFKVKLQTLTPKGKEVAQLQVELNEANKKIPMIEQLMQNRILWSKKLSRVNDLMVPRVWLSEFSLREEKEELENKGTGKLLIIRGSAASRTKDEPALVGMFMQNLKDDPVFSEDFSDIELGPIRKRLIGDTEVMDFNLYCRIKPERIKALSR
ncbi:MAG: hypothetical protein V1727_00670 [Candidatus Omnitrophota bacterium]